MQRSQPVTDTTLANFSAGNKALYPILSEYMGLDIIGGAPKESNALVKPSLVSIDDLVQ